MREPQHDLGGQADRQRVGEVHGRKTRRTDRKNVIVSVLILLSSERGYISLNVNKKNAN